jgi:hypothetical protein
VTGLDEDARLEVDAQLGFASAVRERNESRRAAIAAAEGEIG